MRWLSSWKALAHVCERKEEILSYFAVETVGVSVNNVVVYFGVSN